MITLKIRNARTYVQTQTVEESKAVRKACKIYFKDFRTGLQSIDLYDFKTQSVPSSYVTKFKDKLKNNEILNSISPVEFFETDERSPLPKSINLKGIYYDFELKEHQKKAIEATSANIGGFIACPTASGKSIIISETIFDKQQITVLIVPTKRIREQLTELVERFGKSGITSSIEAFNAETLNLHTGRQKKPKIKILVCCFQSLARLTKYSLARFGCVVIDEAHTAYCKSIRYALDNMPNAHYRYGFSGTPWRDQPHEEKVLYAYMGEVLYEYSVEEAIKDGVISKPSFYLLDSGKPDNYMWKVRNPREVMDNGIVYNKVRNRKIAKIASERFNKGKNVFVCFDEIEHINQVSEILKEMGYEHLIAHGQMKDADFNEVAKKAGEQGPKITLATYALGIGADLVYVNSIILASWGKSTIKLFQRLGRGARLKEGEENKFEIYDFADSFNRVLSKHSWERRKEIAKVYKINTD